MVEYENRWLSTVTVIGSQVAMTPEGATALVLTTEELGTTAFVLTLETIAIIRQELAHAETLLRLPIGRA